jgi:hypothetical protein
MSALFGEVQVTAVGLRLTREGVLQVLLTLGTLECHGVLLPESGGIAAPPVNRHNKPSGLAPMQSFNAVHRVVQLPI